MLMEENLLRLLPGDLILGTHRDTMERQCHDFATNLIGNLPAPKAKNQKAEAGYWEGLLTQAEALLG